MTARALVAASPTVTHDGAVVVGSRSTSAWALDARTGAVLRTFTSRAGGRALAPTVELGAEEEDEEAFGGADAAGDLSGALLLGRTEYTVRSLDAVTGAERWNVTFAELAPLGAADATLQPASADAGARLPLAPGGARLVLGADQTLRSLGPRVRCSAKCCAALIAAPACCSRSHAACARRLGAVFAAAGVRGGEHVCR